MIQDGTHDVVVMCFCVVFDFMPMQSDYYSMG